MQERRHHPTETQSHLLQAINTQLTEDKITATRITRPIFHLPGYIHLGTTPVQGQ
jgi:hypothetical protein